MKNIFVSQFSKLNLDMPRQVCKLRIQEVKAGGLIVKGQPHSKFEVNLGLHVMLSQKQN